jgi:hypothetical protein
MLTHNKIPGIAATVFTQMDTEKYIRYNISSKVSVKQFFSGPVNKKRLLGVLEGVVDAMISAEEYMIEPNSLLLDEEYIFADVSTFETVMICVPVLEMSNTQTNNLNMFFKNILFNTQFDQTESCDHVAKIINYLNSSPVISLQNMKDVLKEIKSGGTQNQEKKAATEVKKQDRPIQQPIVPQQAQILNQQQKQAVFNAQTSEPSKPVEEPKPNMPQKSEEKETGKNEEISFMYLMQHYNKENAATYKEQKKNKKDKDNKKDSKSDKRTKETTASPAAQPAFAVPGMTQQNVYVAPIQSEQVTTEKQTVHQPQVNLQGAANLPQMPTIPADVSGNGANFGNTTVLNSSMKAGETVVLNATNTVAVARPFLIRAKNNEKILINKPVYRIGKERSYVDYFIGDNSTISRSHANIVTRDGAYYIVDTNSTNHTFVNGVMIQSNIETKLANGTKIRLANEEFEFKLI